MSVWTNILIGFLTIIGVAAVNIFLVGVYVGRYRRDVDSCKTRLDDIDAEEKDKREMMTNVRERLRWCESKLNGKEWKKGV